MANEPIAQARSAGAPLRPLISVVVPVYRSEGSIDALYQRLVESLDKISPHWEIVFVEDCSPDGVWAKIERIAESDGRVRPFQLMRNYGQQRAIQFGLSQSEGDFVVTMDDDLQHRPEEIVTLLSALEENRADVVIGRYREKKHGLVRRIGTRVVKWLAEKTVGVPPTLSLTSFRMMRREVAHAVARIRHSNPVVGYLLYAVTTRIVNAEVEHDPRRVGTSNYTFRDLIDYFLCMVIDYSDWPLRAVSGMGVLISLASFSAAIFYVYRWLSGAIQVGGFATIVVLVTLLSGFVLIGLGIIGSYLVRTLRQHGPGSYVTVRTSPHRTARSAQQ